jgi:hypothetical protein
MFQVRVQRRILNFDLHGTHKCRQRLSIHAELLLAEVIEVGVR